MAEIVILPDADAAGSLVAREIAALIARTPDAVLGLATGSTPLPVYRALARLVADLDVEDGRFPAQAEDHHVGLGQLHRVVGHVGMRRVGLGDHQPTQPLAALRWRGQQGPGRVAYVSMQNGSHVISGRIARAKGPGPYRSDICATSQASAPAARSAIRSVAL